MSALVIAGLAAAAAAAARYGQQRAQAKGMMPDEWKDYLAELEGGDLGVTPAQRASMEAEQASMRGGAMADAQQRQLQQAQSMAGSGAIGARELFLNDLATQQAQGQMLNQQTQQIQAAELAAEETNRAMMMDLQQREASQEAAKKAALWSLLGGFASAAGTAATGVAGANQAAAASQQMLEQQARAQEAARMQAAQQQMQLQMVGAYGSGSSGLDYYDQQYWGY